MSQSTTAAVRQNEMNVNITLLTTTICAARTADWPDAGRGGSNGVMVSILGGLVPKRGEALRRLVNDGELVGPAADSTGGNAAHHSESGSTLSTWPGKRTETGRRG